MPPEPTDIGTAGETVHEIVIDATPPRAPYSKATVGLLVLPVVLALSVAAALTWAESKSDASTETQVAAASTAIADPFASLTLQARSAFVIDLATQKTLFEKNADAQLPLASITKVPLVLVAAEALDESERVTISREAVERGEGGGLGTGDMWRTGSLMDFTLLASSNAGAEALAESAGPQLRAKYPSASENAAVWRMNSLVKELGLIRTYFLNPSGLDVSLTQASAFSSARETAILVAYAAQTAPELFAVTTKKEAMLGPQNGTPGRVENTNEALYDIPGLILGKTGFTDLAGGNLAIVFEIEPAHPVAIVVMGSTSDGRFSDMRKLVEAVRSSTGIQ